MIANKDRSGYFGASDTNIICGNWDTKSFENWWLIKLGIHKQELCTESVLAGNAFEHKIIDAIDTNLEKDKQIIIDNLRVNLDANSKDTIYEIKTYKADKSFKVPKNYWRQVQAQMYGSGFRKAFIAAYPLTKKEYNNYFINIDKNKIIFFEIEYDENFIKNEYLPNLRYLSKCLKNGKYPIKEEIFE